jgi:hypothetical protein
MAGRIRAARAMRVRGCRRRWAALSAVAWAPVLIAACGGDDGSGSSAQGGDLGRPAAELPVELGLGELEEAFESDDPCAAVIIGGHLLPAFTVGASLGEEPELARRALPWLISASRRRLPSLPGDAAAAVGEYRDRYRTIAQDVVDADSDAESDAVVARALDGLAPSDVDRLETAISRYLHDRCEALLTELGLWEPFADVSPEAPADPADRRPFASARDVARALGCEPSFGPLARTIEGPTSSGFCYASRGEQAVILFFATSADAADGLERERRLSCRREPPVWVVRGTTFFIEVGTDDAESTAKDLAPRVVGHAEPLPCSEGGEGSSDCTVTQGRSTYRLEASIPCDDAAAILRAHLRGDELRGGWMCYLPPGSGSDLLCEGPTRDLAFSADLISH